MSTKRWMKNTIDAAKACDTKMPWERGTRRQDMISRRLERDDRPTKISLAPLPKGMVLAS